MWKVSEFRILDCRAGDLGSFLCILSGKMSINLALFGCQPEVMHSDKQDTYAHTIKASAAPTELSLSTVLEGLAIALEICVIVEGAHYHRHCYGMAGKVILDMPFYRNFT